jgi:hypothetical protein
LQPLPLGSLISDGLAHSKVHQVTDEGQIGALAYLPGWGCDHDVKIIPNFECLLIPPLR